VDPTRLEIKAEVEAVAVGDEVDLNVVLEHPDSIVCKALTGNLAMKDWGGFTGTMKRIFETIKKEVHGGDPASYIPILAEANREWFAASICTVDGQQWSTGDLDISFSIQSCTKVSRQRWSDCSSDSVTATEAGDACTCLTCAMPRLLSLRVPARTISRLTRLPCSLPVAPSR
jgi:hypothetical protein